MTREEYLRWFGDCPEAEAGPALGGIFEGEGLRELGKVTMTTTPGGPRCVLRCQECGHSWEMLFGPTQANKFEGWDAMVYIANRVQPPGWEYDKHERRLAPAGLFCSCGDYKLAPMFTAEEASNAVKAAISQGWYPGQRARQVQDHIHGVQQQQQGQPQARR
jgi:hypothetical protein